LSAGSLDLARFDLLGLLAGCVENLRAVYDERRAIFPYSTRLVNGSFVNDYEHPQAIRYTINTLLGLSEAARAGNLNITQDEAREMTEAFLERQRARVDTYADRGLLTLLVTEYGDPRSSTVIETLDSLRDLFASVGRRHLNLQDLAWTIWGACSAVRHGVAEAEPLARAAFEVVRSDFVDSESGLPRHSTRRYRRGIVSFGSVVYFLRAIHEYVVTFGDTWAEALFKADVQRVVNLQGPLGEWPWMIGVRSGVTFDVYPVFSVHQDSMAMLFLLPAYDHGISEARSTIERSLAWGFGKNELSVDFYPRDPFHAYRSIERVERLPRVRRYARGLAHAFRRRDAAFHSAPVRVNRECRSYHLGWILYAWAGRREARGKPALGALRAAHDG
jgi:hypothetical protein